LWFLLLLQRDGVDFKVTKVGPDFIRGVWILIGDEYTYDPGAEGRESAFTSVILPEGITEIGEDAFAYCSELVVTVPKSVTSIGYNAFHGCKSVIYQE